MLKSGVAWRSGGLAAVVGLLFADRPDAPLARVLHIECASVVWRVEARPGSMHTHGVLLLQCNFWLASASNIQLLFVFYVAM